MTYDPMAWAEGLIQQLPEHHEGAASWLLNHGNSPRAHALRAVRAAKAAEPVEAHSWPWTAADVAKIIDAAISLYDNRLKPKDPSYPIAGRDEDWIALGKALCVELPINDEPKTADVVDREFLEGMAKPTLRDVERHHKFMTDALNKHPDPRIVMDPKPSLFRKYDGTPDAVRTETYPAEPPSRPATAADVNQLWAAIDELRAKGQ